MIESLGYGLQNEDLFIVKLMVSHVKRRLIASKTKVKGRLLKIAFNLAVKVRVVDLLPRTVVGFFHV